MYTIIYFGRTNLHTKKLFPFYFRLKPSFYFLPVTRKKGLFLLRTEYTVLFVCFCGWGILTIGCSRRQAAGWSLAPPQTKQAKKQRKKKTSALFCFSSRFDDSIRIFGSIWAYFLLSTHRFILFARREPPTHPPRWSSTSGAGQWCAPQAAHKRAINYKQTKTHVFRWRGSFVFPRLNGKYYEEDSVAWQWQWWWMMQMINELHSTS